MVTDKYRQFVEAMPDGTLREHANSHIATRLTGTWGTLGVDWPRRVIYERAYDAMESAGRETLIWILMRQNWNFVVDDDRIVIRLAEGDS